MNNTWHYIPKDGNPKKEGRYLIAYMYNGIPNLRYFIADFIYDSGNWYWQAFSLTDAIAIIAWQEIEPFVFPDELKNDSEIGV